MKVYQNRSNSDCLIVVIRWRLGLGWLIELFIIIGKVLMVKLARPWNTWSLVIIVILMRKLLFQKSLLDDVDWNAWFYEPGMPPVKPQ